MCIRDSYKSERLEEKYPGIMFSQFMGAEMIVKKHGFTKGDLDAYAFESHRRAKAATEAGRFQREIVGLDIDTPDGRQTHLVDEGIRFDATLDGIAGVKLLQEGGTITAASSSQICDGASGVLVVSAKALKEHGLTPIARIHAFGVTAGDPVIMLEEPLPATKHVLKRAGMSINDIDLYAVTAALASVPLARLKPPGARPGSPCGASPVSPARVRAPSIRACGIAPCRNCRGGRYPASND